MLTQDPRESDTAGSRLARGRTRLELTLEQVAEKLRLDTSTVVALENDDHRAIGAAVFVRGFLRRYAEVVGESAADIDALYAKQPDSERRPDLSKTGMHRLESGGQGSRLGVVPALIGATALALVGVAWWAIHAKPRATSSSSNGAEIQTQSDTRAQGEVHTQTQVITGQPVVSAVPGSATAAPTPAASTVVSAGAAAPADGAQAQQRRRHLQLTFSTESWAEIYDARGVRLYFGFGHTGASQVMTGVAPFRVVLANVAATALSFEGAPVSLPATPAGTRLHIVVNGSGVATTAR